MTERYISTTEAARRMGLTGETLRVWAESGSIPAIRTPSGRYRIDWPAAIAAMAVKQDETAETSKEGEVR